MKKNVAQFDRVFRILLAVIIAGLYFANLISGLTAVVLLALAAVFIITAFVGFCPLYALFGISTKKTNKR